MKKNWGVSEDLFLIKVHVVVQQRNNLSTNVNNVSNEQDVPQNIETENIDTENIEITIADIVDYCIAQKWFYGNSTGLQNDASENPDKITENSNRDFILFHCCEELELLSREYSNDEGGDTSCATGPQADAGTENPDFLIQKGLAQSVLHRVPLPPVDWDNPLAEHTPALLQKAFPFIFKSGDSCLYQKWPMSIIYPKTTWLTRFYMVLKIA